MTYPYIFRESGIRSIRADNQEGTRKVTMKTVFDFQRSRRIEKEKYRKCISLSGGVFHVNHVRGRRNL